MERIETLIMFLGIALIGQGAESAIMQGIFMVMTILLGIKYIKTSGIVKK